MFGKAPTGWIEIDVGHPSSRCRTRPSSISVGPGGSFRCCSCFSVSTGRLGVMKSRASSLCQGRLRPMACLACEHAAYERSGAIRRSPPAGVVDHEEAQMVKRPACPAGARYSHGGNKRGVGNDKARSKPGFVFEIFGVADGARTHDNRNHNPGLYQLSYSHRKPQIIARSGASPARTAREKLSGLRPRPVRARPPGSWP